MRKHNKKLEAARKTLEDLQSKTTELEERRMEAYAELTRAQNGVVDTRLAMPTAQDMGLDETDAQVREAEAALTRAKEESAAKQSKTNANECDASARAQAKLDKAIGDASRAFFGGKLAVGGGGEGGENPTQPSQSSRCSGRADVSNPFSEYFHLGPAG